MSKHFSLNHLLSEWRSYIRQKTQSWLQHVAWWLTSYKQPVHVIVYENLVQSPEWEMYELFKFLNYPVTLRNMMCLTENLISPLYKEKDEWMKHDTLFMPETTTFITDAVKKLEPVLRKYNIDQQIIQTFYRFNADQ